MHRPNYIGWINLCITATSNYNIICIYISISETLNTPHWARSNAFIRHISHHLTFQMAQASPTTSVVCKTWKNIVKNPFHVRLQLQSFDVLCCKAKPSFAKTLSICETLSTWKIYTHETQIWNPSKIKCFYKVEGITMAKPLYSLDFPIKIRRQVENTLWGDVGYA
jgi:hypothetical protein